MFHPEVPRGETAVVLWDNYICHNSDLIPSKYLNVVIPTGQ